MGAAIREAIPPTLTADQVCEGFVRLLRRTTGHTKRFTLSTTSQLILPASHDRIAFIVGQPSSGTVYLQFSEAAVIGQGYSTSSTGNTAPFSLWDFGMSITLPVYAIASAGTPTIDILVTQLKCGR